MVTYYAVDGLGSIAVETEGTTIARGTYYGAFGEPQGAALSSFGYTAREPAAPGYYYRARYYSPGIGRFVSEDPIQQFLPIVGGAVYNYVGNDPAHYNDPMGLARCKLIVKYGAAQKETDWSSEWIKTSSALLPQINPITGPVWSALGFTKPAVGTFGFLLEECVWTKYFIVTDYLRQEWTLHNICTCPDSRQILGGGVDETRLGSTKQKTDTAITKRSLGLTTQYTYDHYDSESRLTYTHVTDPNNRVRVWRQPEPADHDFSGWRRRNLWLLRFRRAQPDHGPEGGDQDPDLRRVRAALVDGVFHRRRGHGSNTGMISTGRTPTTRCSAREQA